MKIHDRHILLVDDDEAILNFIRNELAEDGFLRLSTAKNKQDAFDILYRGYIDMAILDIILPDGNGFEIIKHIRTFSNIPVLFLSAVSDVDKGMTHRYWLARGFVLLSDVYVRKGDKFQARQYLTSLQKNYKGNDDIAGMIEERLAKLK